MYLACDTTLVLYDTYFCKQLLRFGDGNFLLDFIQSQMHRKIFFIVPTYGQSFVVTRCQSIIDEETCISLFLFATLQAYFSNYHLNAPTSKSQGHIMQLIWSDLVWSIGIKAKSDLFCSDWPEPRSSFLPSLLSRLFTMSHSQTCGWEFCFYFFFNARRNYPGGETDHWNRPKSFSSSESGCMFDISDDPSFEGKLFLDSVKFCFFDWSLKLTECDSIRKTWTK